MHQTGFSILFLLIFLFLGDINYTQAQSKNSHPSNDDSILTKKEMRKQIPMYIAIGLGTNNSMFRDYATSPLDYSGRVSQISLSRYKLNYKRETELGFSYDFGSYQNSYNNSFASSDLKRFELYFSKLYKVKLFEAIGVNTKLGFLLAGNGNFRINRALQNNGVGIDIFANLLGSIKFTKDISRVVAKDKKFLFIKYKLKEKKRDLAFRINMGLINSSYRNGYVYTGQSTILNDAMVFDDYEFDIFSGIRVSSRLDYTRYLNNKNAVQLSYIWDAYSSGEELDEFLMAHHIIRLTLLFNTNNR